VNPQNPAKFTKTYKILQNSLKILATICQYNIFKGWGFSLGFKQEKPSETTQLWTVSNKKCRQSPAFYHNLLFGTLLELAYILFSYNNGLFQKKYTHPRRMASIFDPPLLTGFPRPLEPPSCPDFQAQGPPLPPGFPLLFLKALTGNNRQWKRCNISSKRSPFIIILKAWRIL